MKSFLDFFRKPAPPKAAAPIAPTVRNRDGGLAWINLTGSPYAACLEQLNNRYVTTEHRRSDGLWVISPQRIQLTGSCMLRDRELLPGEWVKVIAMHDQWLVPVDAVPDEILAEEIRIYPAVPAYERPKETT